MIPRTPNMDRLNAETGRREAALDFLSWLNANGYHLGRYTPGRDRLGPAFTKPDLLVLQWLGIDPAEVEPAPPRPEDENMLRAEYGDR